VRRTIPAIAARITIPIALSITFIQVAAAQSPGTWTKSIAPGPTQAFESIDLDTRLLRFWDSSGAPIGVIQYVLMLHDVITADGPVPTVAMGLRLTGAAPQATDSSWTQATGPSAEHSGDRFATGLAIVPLGAGTMSWYLTLGRVGSDTQQQGAVSHQEPLQNGSIVVSDLALAGDDSSDSWEFRGQPVRLGRADLFDRKHPIHVSYQVKSDSSRDGVRTWITLTNVSDPTRGTRLPQESFLGTLHAGITFDEREIDLSKQKPGRYQLELQVGSIHGGGTSVRMATFTLK
jgi:hypothetical protein